MKTSINLGLSVFPGHSHIRLLIIYPCIYVYLTIAFQDVPVNSHTPLVLLHSIAAYRWSWSQCHEFGAAYVRGPGAGIPWTKPARLESLGNFLKFMGEGGCGTNTWSNSQNNGSETNLIRRSSVVKVSWCWGFLKVVLVELFMGCRRLGLLLGFELPSLKFRRGVNHETRRVVHHWKPCTLVCQH